MKPVLLAILFAFAAYAANGAVPVWANVTNGGGSSIYVGTVRYERSLDGGTTWSTIATDSVGTLNAGQTSANEQLSNANTDSGYFYRPTFISTSSPLYGLAGDGREFVGSSFTWDVSTIGVQPDWLYEKCYVNESPYPVIYEVDDGVATYDSPVINPGEEFCLQYQNSSKQDISITGKPQVYNQDGSLRDGLEYLLDSILSSDTLWWQDGQTPTPAATTSDTGGGLGTGVPGDNIDWNVGGSDLALDSTLRDVGSVLHEDLTVMRSSIPSAVSSVGNQIAGTTSAVNGLSDGIDAISTAVSAQGTTLDSIDGKTSTGNSILNEISANTLATSQSTGAANTWLQSIDATLAAGGTLEQGQIDELQDMGLTLTTIKDGIELIWPDVDSIRSAAQQIDTNTDGIETALEGIKGRQDQQLVDLGDIEDNTQSIDTNTDDLEGNTDEIEPKLDEIKGVLDNIADDAQTIADNTTPQGGDLPDQAEMNADGAQDVNDGEAAAETVRNNLQAYADGVPDYTGPTDFRMADTTPLEIALPLPNGTTYIVSADPAAHPKIAAVCGWVKALVVWLINIIIPYTAFKKAQEYMLSAMLAVQASASGQSVAGTNVNLIAQKIAAGLIVAALAAVPLFFTSYFSGYALPMGSLASPPLTSNSGSMDIALHLVECFIPLASLVVGILTVVAFHFAIAPVTWVAVSVVRFVSV